MNEALEQLLHRTLTLKASDLYLSSDQAPYPFFRIDGDLVKATDADTLQLFAQPAAIFNSLTNAIKGFNENTLSADFALQTKSARFRVNYFRQINGQSAVFRPIGDKAHTMHELGLPPVFSEIANSPRGLVLVCGVTGSGKSTTLSAMIEHLNTHTQKHIIVLGEPVEQLFDSNKSLIQQREIGVQCASFAQGLRDALRESPDVIVVSELRDLETIRLALSAAETGHLVMATLHSLSCAKAIDRLIEVFPESEKTIVRTMLSTSLYAVTSQRLFKRVGGSGRIAAHEILLATPAIRNLIREGKIEHIENQIQTGKKLGMTTFSQSIEQLVRDKKIHPDAMQNTTATSWNQFAPESL